MLAYMKRTTVKLPDDLDARLRHEAARRGTTVSETHPGSDRVASGRGRAPPGRRRGRAQRLRRHLRADRGDPGRRGGAIAASLGRCRPPVRLRRCRRPAPCRVAGPPAPPSRAVARAVSGDHRGCLSAGQPAGAEPEVRFLGDLAVPALSLSSPSPPPTGCGSPSLCGDYRYLPLGTVDASLVAAAERLGVREVATMSTAATSARSAPPTPPPSPSCPDLCSGDARDADPVRGADRQPRRCPAPPGGDAALCRRRLRRGHPAGAGAPRPPRGGAAAALLLRRQRGGAGRRVGAAPGGGGDGGAADRRRDAHYLRPGLERGAGGFAGGGGRHRRARPERGDPGGGGVGPARRPLRLRGVPASAGGGPYGRLASLAAEPRSMVLFCAPGAWPPTWKPWRRRSTAGGPAPSAGS